MRVNRLTRRATRRPIQLPHVDAGDPCRDRARLGRVGFAPGPTSTSGPDPAIRADSIAHLMATAGIIPGSRVLDLAAGTGKLTRQLDVPRATCVAVEPSASMREVFGRMVPGHPLIGGTAEMIPLASGSIDAVVVAQAFHWFDPPRRSRRSPGCCAPGGWLALIWNERDESDPVIAELVRISKWDQCQPYPMGMDFGRHHRSPRAVPPGGTRASSRSSSRSTATEFVEQVASRSYVQVLPDRERQALLDQVADFGATLGDPIAMPYVTDLFCAQGL